MASTIRSWEFWLYPELRQFEPAGQAAALKAATDAGFDGVEQIGLIVALAATVLLTRYSAAGMGLADRFGAAIANFVVAIPVLVVVAGPFYVRRTRRGLRKQLKSMHAPAEGAQ